MVSAVTDMESTLQPRGEKFGERLLRLKVAKGYGEVALASRTGIKRMRIHHLILGRRQPHAGEIAKLADALDLGASDLLEGVDLPPTARTVLAEEQELVRQVFAMERERDDVSAKLIESLRSARLCLQERARLQLTVVQQRMQIENIGRAFAGVLAVQDKAAATIARELIRRRSAWSASLAVTLPELANLPATNRWLRARVRQLEGRLREQWQVLGPLTSRWDRAGPAGKPSPPGASRGGLR